MDLRCVIFILWIFLFLASSLLYLLWLLRFFRIELLIAPLYSRSISCSSHILTQQETKNVSGYAICSYTLVNSSVQWALSEHAGDAARRMHQRELLHMTSTEIQHELPGQHTSHSAPAIQSLWRGEMLISYVLNVWPIKKGIHIHERYLCNQFPQKASCVGEVTNLLPKYSVLTT